MRKILVLVFSFPILSCPLFAGTIRGTVKAEGKIEAGEDLSSGSYESRKYKFLDRINYADLKEFLVYIDQQIPAGVHPPLKTMQVVIQKDGTFTPHIMPILVGTTVEWPNHDQIYHNVFSMSDPKPFDLGLYKHGEVKKVTFDQAGRIDVFCSIHTKMHCIIWVLENPFYATTNSKGGYTVSNVPAGTYKLKAWHERLPSQIKEITVPETGEVTADFLLSITGLPKY